MRFLRKSCANRLSAHVFFLPNPGRDILCLFQQFECKTFNFSTFFPLHRKCGDGLLGNLSKLFKKLKRFQAPVRVQAQDFLSATINWATMTEISSKITEWIMTRGILTELLKNATQMIFLLSKNSGGCNDSPPGVLLNSDEIESPCYSYYLCHNFAHYYLSFEVFWTLTRHARTV